MKNFTSLIILIIIILLSGCNDRVTGLADKSMTYKIAYTSGDLTGLYIVDDDGMNNKIVIRGKNWLGPLDWGRDKNNLIFQEYIYDTTSIWRINLVTGDKKLLFTQPDMSIHDISISPTGDKVAFALYHISNDAEELRIMNTDGSNQEILFYQTGRFASTPLWLPDGNRILFLLDNQIFGTKPDGSELKQLTNSVGSSSSFSFSPDGQYIVYSYVEGNNSGIFIMDANGSNAHPITPFENSVYREPKWSPDGKYIIFLRNDSALSSQIFRMDSDGNNVKQLTYSEGGHRFSPKFTANGKILYYSNNTNDIQMIDINGENRKQIVQLQQQSIGIQYFEISKVKSL